MTDDVRADARRLLQLVESERWEWYPQTEDDGAVFIQTGPETVELIAETSRARAEFIAAAPTLVDRLLAELDRQQDHYSPDEVNRIREVNKNAQRDLVEVAESLKAERDAVLATLRQVRDEAVEVMNYGGMSAREFAEKLIYLIADGGGAR